MNYSFEYIDIILLAMIAGFIFLRLRGILGKKTGHEENMRATFSHDFSTKKEESSICIGISSNTSSSIKSFSLTLAIILPSLLLKQELSNKTTAEKTNNCLIFIYLISE